MFPQTEISWHDYRALIQNMSYQPTLEDHAIFGSSTADLLLSITVNLF